MSRTRAIRPLAALGAAFLLVVGGGTVAYADGLTLDGDGLAPVVQESVSLLVCAGESAEFDVAIAARRNGDPNLQTAGNANSNVFANASSVGVSVFSASDGMTVTLSSSTITLPANWQTSGVDNDVIIASVVLPAQTSTGSDSGTLVFRHMGVNNSGAAVNGNNEVAVNWKVEDCAPVDETDPVLNLPGDITAEATGPGGASVTWVASATDETSPANPAVSCDPASGSVFPLGATTVSCSATDDAGNTAEGSFTVTVVDTTAPTLSLPADIEDVEATGPDGALVEFVATATDAVSPANPAVSCDPASGSVFPLGATTVSCSATDDAGNTAEGSFTVTVVDTTPPTITWVVPEVEGAQYYYGSVPVFSCTATDIVDGSVDCTVGLHYDTVGEHTATATATDAAGNQATSDRTYTVLAWDLDGFYQPVDMGALNIVKGGSTVPLKFEVFAGDTELTSTTVVSGFTVKGIACPGAGVATDDIEMTSTGGTTLRYDATAGQFIQNWQTPKKPGTCYAVTMTTQDGSFLTAQFKLK